MALSVSSRRVLKRPTTGSERIAKYQRHKTGIILFILCSILVIAIIGTGYLYTWLMSNQIMPNDALTNTERRPVAIQKPTARINQRINVTVSNLSSPIMPGETAQLSIRTNIDAVCNIEVLSPTKKLTDPSLTAKAADEFGIVSWSWLIPKGTPNGTWPLTVSCSNREYSGVVKTNLAVSAQST